MRQVTHYLIFFLLSAILTLLLVLTYLDESLFNSVLNSDALEGVSAIATVSALFINIYLVIQTRHEIRVDRA